MPRVGQNPMKWVSNVIQPASVTATTVVFIPELLGYWENSLKVLDISLQSMRANTRIPFDLMVFDNGSCEEVKNHLCELADKGDIQYLILSQQNQGKVGAWNFMFAAAPGDVIAYSDSDVYFMHDWLHESIQILDAFPEVGMVTAQPISGGNLTVLHTYKAAVKEPGVDIKTGRLVPDKYFKAYLRGVGREDSFELQQENRNDVLLTLNGISAYATASHFQFSTKREMVKQIFPLPSLGLLEDQVFDKELEGRGLWRLSTTSYLVHHMGNRVPDFNKELPWLSGPAAPLDIGSQASQFTESRHKSIIGRLLKNPFIRRIIKMIHVLTYRWLYG